jgi:uncharacterized protein (DUF362 family)/Pyruvate/2-oxoacid:ferredoxin oxidoreductase delta subunit
VKKPSRVAIVRCTSYQREEVARALDEAFHLLGPIIRFIPGGKKVLLKPNMLHGADPENGVITHPEILRAVALLCQQAGYTVTFGDSPSFQTPRAAAGKCGYEKIGREIGMAQANFQNGEERSFPEGKQNKLFFIATGALEADAIINLPKMKTHGFTVMTGAVKNMFGLIPGLRKSWFHARLSDRESFSRMLIDLNRYLTPALSVMDAVFGMEGNGPGNGELVHTGLLLISDDPVALDATACRIMGIRPEDLYFLKYAESIGFGNIHETDIEILGLPVERARGKKYVLHPPDFTPPALSPKLKYLKWFLIPRPVITARKCNLCLQCVRICPVNPKALTARKTKPPVFDYEKCIRCYCCQETCPRGAIRIRVPLPGVFYFGFRRRL